MPTSPGRIRLPDRRRFLQVLGIAGAALVAGPTLAGCSGVRGPVRAGAGPVRGGVLRVAHSSNFSSLDPHAGVSGNDHAYLWPMFDRLVNFDEKTLEPLPGLAQEWSYPSPTTLMLKLRPNVLFHDGTAFDAEAVKFNLERAINDPDSSVAVDLASIDNVRAVSADTVEISLSRPDTALPLVLSDRAGMMVSPAAVTQSGADFERSPVGAGPFRLKRAISNEVVELERFDRYWQPELPHLDGMVYTIFGDGRTAANAAADGQQDFVVDVEVTDVRRLEGIEELQVIRGPSLSMERTPMRMGSPPFDDVRVRQAINYAVNREGINAAVLQGLGEAAYAELPPTHWAYPRSITPTYPHDPAKARQLLAEAGYPNGLTVEAVAVTTEPSRSIAVAMQGQLVESGIDMKVTVLDHTEANEAFRERGEYQLFFSGWSGRPDPYQTYAAHYLSASAYVTDYAEPPELASLMDATIATSDLESRAAAFLTLATLGRDQALDLTTVFKPTLQAASIAVGGYQANLYGKPILTKVWLAPSEQDS